MTASRPLTEAHIKLALDGTFRGLRRDSQSDIHRYVTVTVPRDYLPDYRLMGVVPVKKGGGRPRMVPEFTREAMALARELLEQGHVNNTPLAHHGGTARNFKQPRRTGPHGRARRNGMRQTEGGMNNLGTVSAKPVSVFMEGYRSRARRRPVPPVRLPTPALKRDWIHVATVAPRTAPKGREVLAACALHFGVSVYDLRSSRRFAVLEKGRLAFYVLARDLTQLSFPQIGRIIDRDHSTVLKCARRSAWLPQIKDDIAAIRTALSDGRPS